MTLQHKFVEFIPDFLNEGVVYVSMEYCTAIHKCACGCGNEVVTPISPTDWKLTFDGKGISLYPSIGNWSFECKSHYWIKNSKINWAEEWSSSEIKSGREHDKKTKDEYFKDNISPILKKEKKNKSILKTIFNKAKAQILNYFS